MYGDEAKLSGGRNIVAGVVDENGSANLQAASTNQKLEYCRVWLHEPHIARENQFVEAIEEGIKAARNLEFIAIVVANGMHRNARMFQPRKNRHAVVDGTREQF